MKFNLLVDYLKFRIGYRVSEFDDCLISESVSAFAELADVLKLDFSKFDREECLKSWGSIRFYGESRLNSLPSSKMRSAEYGEHYCIFEMSGEACREFERRGGDFGSLFNLICFHDGFSFARVDLAVDIFHHYFSQSELIFKVLNREYIGTHGGGKFREDFEVLGLNEDELKVADVFNSSWSLTAGSHKTNQRQFYNKAAEQYSKTHSPELVGKYWVRFEQRFIHDSAELVGRSLSKAFNDGRVNDYFASLLYRNMFFVDHFDDRKKAENIWGPWSDLVSDIGSIYDVDKPFKSNYSSMPLSVYKSYNWLINNVRATLQKFYLLSPDDFFTFVLSLVKCRTFDVLPVYKKSDVRDLEECFKLLDHPAEDFEKKLSQLLLKEDELKKINDNKLIKLINSFYEEFEAVKSDDALDKKMYLNNICEGLPF